VQAAQAGGCSKDLKVVTPLHREVGLQVLFTHPRLPQASHSELQLGGRVLAQGARGRVGRREGGVLAGDAHRVRGELLLRLGVRVRVGVRIRIRVRIRVG